MTRRAPHLFGKYLRQLPAEERYFIRKKQFSRVIPVKAYGRPPSARSQKGFFHDEDYNFYTKIGKTIVQLNERRLVCPYVLRKQVTSHLLNYTFKNLPMTTTALEAMNRLGGLDAYVLQTPPEELRSTLGEKLRELMYYYLKHPAIWEWKLPPSLMLTRDAKRDPWYIRHRYQVRRALAKKALARAHRRTSPYYLPSRRCLLPERQPFVKMAGKTASMPLPFSGSLKQEKTLRYSVPKALWWTESQQLETAFRQRLEKAKPFEKAHPNARTPGSFFKGKGRGGGGRHNKPKHQHQRQHVQRLLA